MSVQRQIVRMLVATLFPLLDASSPHPTQERKPSLYGIWLVHEERPSEDHWLRRDYLTFRRENSSGQDYIDADTECRTQRGVVRVSVTARAKIQSQEFMVFNSEDESETQYGVTCSVHLYRLTARYELSEDGESVSVNDGKRVKQWQRHD